MKSLGTEKLYCSLDIETSGFDPLTNEILEVGFAFFILSDKGLEITEEWTQVFKPSKLVSPQILGLTGISREELDEAPKFSEYQKFLQNKLGSAVIVGHNVVFDIKFLEAFGIKFSGQTIDTLDLVQWILPTHHSYNLENLMHTFGISHKDAHRALADSKATILLLEKLLQVYNSFDSELKKQIQKLFSAYDFVWKDFLNSNLPPVPFKDLKEDGKKEPTVKLQKADFKPQPGIIYNFGLNQDFIKTTASALAKSRNKNLLVVPKLHQALELFRQGLADGVACVQEQSFDEKKFKALLNKKNLAKDEVKFLLKILVWQATNWQTDTFSDLNLSFFGGQFKELISGGKLTENKSAAVVVCDFSAFLEITQRKFYKDRQIVICGLDEFEKAVSQGIGTKTSWGYITYLLKSFYNFELNIGQEKFKEPAQQALAATDLFFGLVSALLQTDPPGFLYFKITPAVEYEEKYQKIKSAGENYAVKLLGLNEAFCSPAIAEFAGNLAKFFTAEDNKVKWIELTENRCTLLSMPIDIRGLVQEVLQPYGKLSFMDALGPDTLPNFFVKRLGLENFRLEGIVGVKHSAKQKSKQGDLFSGIKKVFGSKNQEIHYHCLPQTADSKELLGLVGPASNYPAAVLFGSSMQAREFYDANYLDLKQKASVLVQSGSGGSNKIFRNFGINPNSLLLATDKFILKALSGQAQVEQVNKLAVKLLVVCRLPFEQFTHPYQEAISQSLPNAFMDYALPRALFNFHSLLEFFYTPLLEDVYIIDPKLSKDYAGVFKDYYKFIPNAKSVND